MEPKLHSSISETIAERVEFWGNTEPSNPAFIFWGSAGRFVLSRGDVLDLSSRFASRLRQHGLRPRDVVCSALPNSPERVVVDFGVQLAGGIPMNAQVLRADGQDLVESMKMSQCKMLVVDPDVDGGAWNICKQHFEVQNVQHDFGKIVSIAVPTLSVVEFCRTHKPEMTFLKSLQNESNHVAHGSQPSDTAYLFATSGSAGFSKIVPHTHKSLLRMAHLLNNCTKTTGTEKYCTCAPLGWIGGFPLNFLHSGCPRVLFDDSNGNIPDRLCFLWEMMSTEVVHTATLMPAMYMGINAMNEVWKRSTFRLKRLVSGGQPMKQNYLDVIGHLTDSIFCLYASTELGSICGKTLQADDTASFIDNSTGMALDGVEIKIVDEHLSDVASCSRGEILIRSETCCSEYVGSNRSSFLADGWFRTDDVGYMHNDGFLVVEGRRSDAIMHGGYILYPYWLEKKLNKCPGVKQAVIVPVPDPDLHNEICACVQPEGDASVSSQHIIDFCRSEMTVDVPSDMKFIPKYVVNFDVFPLTKTFKLDRKQTASIAKEKLGV